MTVTDLQWRSFPILFSFYANLNTCLPNSTQISSVALSILVTVFLMVILAIPHYLIRDPPMVLTLATLTDVREEMVFVPSNLIINHHHHHPTTRPEHCTVVVALDVG